MPAAEARMRYLAGLVREMDEDLASSSSGGAGGPTVACQAYREAKRLKDPTLIDPLIELIEQTDSAWYRRLMLRILRFVGANSGDARAARFMCEWLDVERSRPVQSELVEALADQREILDPRPVMKQLRHPDEWTRGKALEILGRCSGAGVTRSITAFIRRAEKPAEIAAALRALETASPRRALALALELMEDLRGRVRVAATGVVARLGDRRHLGHMLDALSERDFQMKQHAMHGIRRFGDESCIEPVAKRVKVILARRRPELGFEHDTELIDAMAFLQRYVALDPDVEDLFRYVRRRRWDHVLGYEKVWLILHLPFFARAEISAGPNSTTG